MGSSNSFLVSRALKVDLIYLAKLAALLLVLFLFLMWTIYLLRGADPEPDGSIIFFNGGVSNFFGEWTSVLWLIVDQHNVLNWLCTCVHAIYIYTHCMYMPRSMSAVWLEIVPILFGSMYFFFMGERWRWMNIDCIFADPSTYLERPPIGRDNTYGYKYIQI